jgi:hypothetical protein
MANFTQAACSRRDYTHFDEWIFGQKCLENIRKALNLLHS